MVKTNLGTVLSATEVRTLMGQIDEATAWAVSIRRQLHRFPEEGLKEFRTRSIIEDKLKELGAPAKRLWETGVIADITGARELAKLVVSESNEQEPFLVVRAEMDAIPIAEKTGYPFSSAHAGMMHGCGHDVHMAVLLGTARVLMKNRELLRGTVRLLFQPAEETSGGAVEMIKNGGLRKQEPKNEEKERNREREREREADVVFGLHVKPELPAGAVGFKRAEVHAASDLFSIRVTGRSCHGAYPHQGADAIVCGAQIVSQVQSIVARNVDPLDAAVITFGTINGGTARNVIADTLTMEGTIRTLREETRMLVKTRLTELVTHVAMAAAMRAEINFEPGYVALINHDQPLDQAREACRRWNELTGESRIETIELKNPTMGVEDFAYYLKKIPGAYFFLGSGFAERENLGLHSAEFLVNEDCVKTGIELLTAITLHYSRIL